LPVTLDPLAAREPVEQGAIEAAGGALVDVLRRRLLAQACEPQPGGQPLAVAFQGLALHQHGQAVLEAEFDGIGVPALLLKRPGHAGETKLAQAVRGGMGQHGGAPQW